LAGAASAQGAKDYPNRPVRVLITSPAGGGSDFIMRPVAQKLTERLKQTFVLDNRAGASGIIAMEIAAKATPDGYTLVLGTIGSTTTNFAIHDKLPFHPIRDYQPISQLIASPFFLAVHPSVPVGTVPELLAFAKASPGKVTYGSFGIGSYPHLLMEHFAKRNGVQFTHVPYKGSAPAIADLLGGQITMMFDSMQSAYGHVRAKKLKALAIGTRERYAPAGELPTFAEAGYPWFEATAWFGLLAPAGTPRPIVDLLHAEIVRAVASPDVRERYDQMGVISVAGTPEQFARQIRESLDTFVKVAKESNVRAN
jgi:tripartite-type tricarboxylate transporter receptor subunit TctC